MAILYLCYFITLAVHIFITAECADSTDISRLRAEILNKYDNHSRPNLNSQNATQMEIFFHNYGMEFDEQRGMLTLHLLSVMSWVDEHIKWDPLQFGNLSELDFAATELWRPDISVLNNFDNSEIDHFSNSIMMTYSDGFIWWMPQTKFQVGCVMDVRMWPYDKHECSVILSSWAHNGDELYITVPENYSYLLIDPEWNQFVENREWKLLSSHVKGYDYVSEYCCPKISYQEVWITVEIQRRSSSHYVAVTMVGLGIATGILISFWLDPFADERLPLTLLIMLLNAIYLQYMHKVIPNNGGTVPLTICFFRDSLIMVTFSLAWTVAIQYIAKTRRNSPVHLPDCIQTLLNSFVATILCLNPRPTSKGQLQRKTAETTGEDGDISELVEEDDSHNKEDWEWLARLLDRLAFFAYLITYSIFILAFL